VTIRAAREKAAKYAAMAERGEDPAQEFAEFAIDRHDTVSALVEDYLCHARATLRSWRNAERYFNKHFLPSWGRRPAGSITPRDAALLVNKAIQPSADAADGTALKLGAGAEVRKWGSTLFAWALGQRRVTQNPFSKVSGPRLKPRQRFLSMSETRAVWLAAGEMPPPWREAIWLLMLTACRENEICAARRSWIDVADAALHIPAAHYKTGRAFVVPLSRTALKIIADMSAGSGAFLLSTTHGGKPIAGIPRKVLDRVHVRAEAILGQPIEHFRLHDLRRTVRTHLSRLGTPEVVAELLLGHTLKGVQGTYNVYDFATEKRRALEIWSQELVATAN
jgi:integrase